MGYKKQGAKNRVIVIQKEKKQSVFLHPAFCNPYFGPFFEGSKTDPCFQNKNIGRRLTEQVCT